MKDAATYQRLVQFEERAAALYRKLAGRFVDNVRLSWFWVEMSMEEKQHAGFLQFCAAEQILGGDLPGTESLRRLSKTFDRLERVASRRDVSLDDAFLIAAEVESSELNDIYRRLIGPVCGSWHVLRRKIETTTSGHMDEIVKGARKFGVSESALAKIAEMGK